MYQCVITVLVKPYFSLEPLVTYLQIPETLVTLLQLSLVKQHVLGKPQNCLWSFLMRTFPNSKVHGANMGPIWGRQDAGGPRVGPMNFATWELWCRTLKHTEKFKQMSNKSFFNKYCKYTCLSPRLPMISNSKCIQFPPLTKKVKFRPTVRLKSYAKDIQISIASPALNYRFICVLHKWYRETAILSFHWEHHAQCNKKYSFVIGVYVNRDSHVKAWFKINLQ